MEVILKKSKITSSILKQALRSTESDFKAGEILGWCIYDKIRFIICYRSDTKSLSKYPMFKDLIEERCIRNEKYVLKVSVGNAYIPISYVSETKEERDIFLRLLKEVKDSAETKGQFFI
jgi:hypothetical protein